MYSMTYISRRVPELCPDRAEVPVTPRASNMCRAIAMEFALDLSAMFGRSSRHLSSLGTNGRRGHQLRKWGSISPNKCSAIALPSSGGTALPI